MDHKQEITSHDVMIVAAWGLSKSASEGYLEHADTHVLAAHYRLMEATEQYPATVAYEDVLRRLNDAFVAPEPPSTSDPDEIRDYLEEMDRREAQDG